MLKKWINCFLGKRADSTPYCPVCERKPTVFLPLSDYFLENLRRYGYPHLGKGEMIALDTYSCEGCGASDRERLYAFWINQQISQNRFVPGTKLIHFAPEQFLSEKLRALNFFDYTSADLLMNQVDHQVDITNMSFADEQFDFFICSHVLEHVDSDDNAISELYRILKKTGCGILVVPIVLGLEKTLEDPTVTDAGERWRLFGQDDHVRLYAHDDYVNKMEQHGFSVAQLDQAYFGKSVFQSLGLKPSSILYIVTK